jgi:hypothetical protein
MKGFIRLKHSPPFFAKRHDLIWILLLIAALLFIIFAWPDPASGSFAPQSAATATPFVLSTTTATAIPAEFLESADQTSGIICGSVVLVLIIVGGTIGVLSRKNGSTVQK